MIPDDIILREGTAEDADGVVALFVGVAGEARWIGRELPLDEEAVRSRYLASLDSREHYALVALGPDLLLGHLHLGVEPFGVAELGMALTPAARGQGLGRRMMDVAISWAQARPDLHKIALQVWPHNAAALALYRGCGFEQEGYLRQHYRRRSGELWDAIVMGRKLARP